MERIVRPIDDGGAPYLNQDFVNILQDNNLKSYRSFLDTVNDQKGGGNSGIIVKGVNVIGNTFNFSNSMVYINGEFMELLPTQSINYTPAGVNNLYLRITTLFEDREAKVTGLPVGYIRADGITFTTDQETHTLVKYYFSITDTIPTAGESYIEFEYINNEWVSSRYLNRILKYHMADFGQIFMSTTAKYFEKQGTNLGLGFGPMKGFKWCNQTLGVVTTTGLQHNQTSVNLKGIFLVGLSQSSVDTPQGNFNDLFFVDNYKKLYNRGGWNEILLYPENIPPHTHGTFSGFADNQLKHDHELEVQEPFRGTDLALFPYSTSTTPNLTYNYKLPPVFAKGRKLRNWSGYSEPHASRTILHSWSPRGLTSINSSNYWNLGPSNELGDRITVNPESDIRSDFMIGNTFFDKGLYKALRFGPAGLPNFTFEINPTGTVNLPQFANRWDHLLTGTSTPGGNKYREPLQEWQIKNGPVRTARIVYAKGDGQKITFRIRKNHSPNSSSTSHSQNFLVVNNLWFGPSSVLNSRDGTEVTISGLSVPGFNITGKWTLGPVETATWQIVDPGTGDIVNNQGIFEFYLDSTETNGGVALGEYSLGNTSLFTEIGAVDWVAQIPDYPDRDDDPISTHTHEVSTTGIAHNNIPNCYDVVYYEKIAV